MSKKVKSIELKIKMEGIGIVNYDGQGQKYLINKSSLKQGVESKNKNITFAKVNYYDAEPHVDEKGKHHQRFDRKIKISPQCLLHEVFKGEVPARTQNIMHNKHLLYSVFGSPHYLLRGNAMLAKGIGSFKRKSAITLTDLEQTNGAVPYIETFSRSGEKNEDLSDDRITDNTFFKKETVGDIEYEGECFIDMNQLQFVSGDKLYDRYGFDPEDFDLLKDNLKMRLQSFSSELGYYLLKGSIQKIPEYGFLLGKDDIVNTVKYLLYRLINARIGRGNAFARVSDIQIKLVTQPIDFAESTEDKWESLTLDFINDLDFDPFFYYEEMEEKGAKDLRKSMEEGYELHKQKRTKLDSKKKKDTKS